MKGKLIETYHRPTQLSPHIPHATHDWEGERWCLSVYTTRTVAQVDPDTMRALEKLKFPIRRAAASRTFGEKRHVTFMSSNHQEPQKSCDDVDVDDADEGLSQTPQRRRSSCEKLEGGLQFPPGADHGDNATILAPKKKEEYVMAVASRCRVSPTELRANSLDRLKELWNAVRPPRKNTILPPHWKKLDLQGLRELYSLHVVEDLGRDQDHHWARWSRGQVIMETEMWAADARWTASWK